MALHCHSRGLSTQYQQRLKPTTTTAVVRTCAPSYTHDHLPLSSRLNATAPNSSAASRQAAVTRASRASSLIDSPRGSTLLMPGAPLPLAEAQKQGSLGFGFSAGGLLFPYYVGMVMALRDELGILRDDTLVAGASAGSLIAATVKSGISESDLLDATMRLARDCRDNGTRFRLKTVLQRTLAEVLPDDIHERCAGTVHIAVTKVWPEWQPELVSQFASRQELIDALLVSCHIPWYFDGSLVTKYGEHLAFDGGITNFIPVPPCAAPVRVACFPSRELKVFNDIGISPDTFEDWPHDMRQMIRWALEPASDEMLMSLVEKGKRDARSWALQHGLTTAPALATAEISGIYLN